MEMHVMTLEIMGQDQEGGLVLSINGLNQLSIISYHEQTRVIKFHDNNELSRFLVRNEKQFRKILHAKKGIILKPGFKLKFALCEKKDVDAFNDINNIKSLEILANEKQLRIVTDSQYVRKGITEWIFYWKLNGWLTANGRQVRNIEFWKKFDRLTENKYIEFQRVKSHSGHFENTICDLYAKEKASGNF